MRIKYLLAAETNAITRLRFTSHCYAQTEPHLVKYMFMYVFHVTSVKNLAQSSDKSYTNTWWGDYIMEVHATLIKTLQRAIFQLHWERRKRVILSWMPHGSPPRREHSWSTSCGNVGRPKTCTWTPQSEPAIKITHCDLKGRDHLRPWFQQTAHVAARIELNANIENRSNNGIPER